MVGLKKYEKNVTRNGEPTMCELVQGVSSTHPVMGHRGLNVADVVTLSLFLSPSRWPGG